MTENSQAVLLNYLNQHYFSLKHRLTRRLGNSEMAADALHDTWLRLKHAEEIGMVRDPASYLLRMAVNIAVDVHRRHSRLLTGDDIEALLSEVADPAPSPESQAESWGELEALLVVIQRMPARRRAVALMVHAEGITQKEVAQRLGVSLRTVEYELQYIHDRFNKHMQTREQDAVE